MIRITISPPYWQEYGTWNVPTIISAINSSVGSSNPIDISSQLAFHTNSPPDLCTQCLTASATVLSIPNPAIPQAKSSSIDVHLTSTEPPILCYSAKHFLVFCHSNHQPVNNQPKDFREVIAKAIIRLIFPTNRYPSASHSSWILFNCLLGQLNVTHHSAKLCKR